MNFFQNTKLTYKVLKCFRISLVNKLRRSKIEVCSVLSRAIKTVVTTNKYVKMSYNTHRIPRRIKTLLTRCLRVFQFPDMLNQIKNMITCVFNLFKNQKNSQLLKVRITKYCFSEENCTQKQNIASTKDITLETLYSLLPYCEWHSFKPSRQWNDNRSSLAQRIKQVR